MSETKPANLEQWLESALAKARAEERERCVKACKEVAERSSDSPVDYGADDCADAIRALDE